MTIFVGLDLHRAQITYDALDADTGEVRAGRIRPANRGTVAAFLARTRGADQEVVVAVEAMTGWRFFAEECARAGVEVHLAEPAETRERQDRKRRAKTDKLDARLLRELLMQKRLPESWIAPPHILDLRAKVRRRKTLVDQRTQWLQRIHAVLFHHGVAVHAGQLGRLCAEQAREQLAGLDLPGSAVQQNTVALGIIEHLNGEVAGLDRELERFARRQPGCRALMAHYGIGPCVSTAILAELGDTRRMSSSRQAVRCAGLDVTVHQSDARSRGGHLSRQGSPVLRWAAFEARRAPPARARPTTSTTWSSKTASERTVRR
ncbi:MAG TPA: IS110 family transposase [Solirubrobacteraceae bacterium]